METISKEQLIKKNKLPTTEEVANIYRNAFQGLPKYRPNYSSCKKEWETIFMNSKKTQDENDQ